MIFHQSQLTSAFVLHTRPYRETSLLVDFFTQEFGRLTAIARGVRKARSANAGLLMPFVPLCVSFRGKTELLNLTTLETAKANYFLQNQALFCGLYANELLYRLLHKYDPHPGLYIQYQALLVNLQNFTEAKQQQWSLYLFGKKLLQEIGYGVQWDKTVAGDYINANELYHFELESGFSLARNESQMAQDFKIKGRSLLALHHSNYGGGEEWILSGEVLKEIRQIFNTIFHHLLGDKFSLCQRVFGVRNF